MIIDNRWHIDTRIGSHTQHQLINDFYCDFSIKLISGITFVCILFILITFVEIECAKKQFLDKCN